MEKASSGLQVCSLLISWSKTEALLLALFDLVRGLSIWVPFLGVWQLGGPARWHMQGLPSDCLQLARLMLNTRYIAYTSRVPYVLVDRILTGITPF